MINNPVLIKGDKLAIGFNTVFIIIYILQVLQLVYFLVAVLWLG